MGLNVAERHLNRGHTEVIRAKEEYWHLESMVYSHNCLASVEDYVIHHEHSVHPPVWVLLIQISNQLHDE